MSIRRSIAAAVFVAAVSAPTALGAAPALADTAPAPAGQSQPDAPVADVPAAEAPAAEAPAVETPATDAGAGATEPEAGTPAPGETAPAPTGPGAVEPAGPTAAEEQALRDRLTKLMAEPGHMDFYYTKGNAALAGGYPEIKHFLDVELRTVIQDEKRIFATQIMSMTDHRGQLWRTIQNVFNGTDADLDHFLDVTWPAVRLQYEKDAARIAGNQADPAFAALARQALEANDRGLTLVRFIEVEAPAANDAKWSRVLRTLISPGSSLTLTEAAEQALGADVAKAFLAGLDGISDDEIRLRISQAMSIGGPEVKAAVGHVLDGHTSASLHAFLLTGLAEAQARDTANAQQPQGGHEGGTGAEQGGGTTATPVTDTTGTTGTATTTQSGTTAAAGSGTLAFTGADAPLGAITAAGAGSVALGAALVAARRRRQQS